MTSSPTVFALAVSSAMSLLPLTQLAACWSALDSSVFACPWDRATSASRSCWACVFPISSRAHSGKTVDHSGTPSPAMQLALSGASMSSWLPAMSTDPDAQLNVTVVPMCRVLEARQLAPVPAFLMTRSGVRLLGMAQRGSQNLAPSQADGVISLLPPHCRVHEPVVPRFL